MVLTTVTEEVAFVLSESFGGSRNIFEAEIVSITQLRLQCSVYSPGLRKERT